MEINHWKVHCSTHPSGHIEVVTKWRTFWTDFSWKKSFVLKFQRNVFPALIKVIAWGRAEDKPLSKSIILPFIAAYMRHQVSMC